MRFVETRAAPFELLLDTAPPRADTRVLWLSGRAARQTETGAIVLDGAGGIVEFDGRLRARQLAVQSEGREWLSVSPAPAAGLWLTDAGGALLRADSVGRVRVVGDMRFHYPEVSSDPSGDRAWVSRSTKRFTYDLDTTDSPLAVEVDSGGTVLRSVGQATRPGHILLRDLANAGHVAIAGGVIFFAPFVRDELIAFSRSGDTLWVSTRGLTHATPEPRFEVRDRNVVVDYSPVNLGLTLGPDGRLYLLSTPSRTTSESRLDVFDPATGNLLRSAHLRTALPTLAADASGRVYELDPFRLLAGVPPRARPVAPEFDLPSLESGRVTSAGLRGKVTLVNLWASWCAPCREEMPALDSLQRGVRDPAFAFVALTDDVDHDAARRFLREYGFTFTVGVGDGTLRERFHAPGFPVTILIDREGREVRRWFGYAGPGQAGSIRALVLAELDRDGGRSGGHGMHHHGM